MTVSTNLLDLFALTLFTLSTQRTGQLMDYQLQICTDKCYISLQYPIYPTGSWKPIHKRVLISF
jgi:hypothetical protein